MNFNSDVDMDRLRKALEWSDRQLEPFRNLVHGLVQEVSGSTYKPGRGRPKYEGLLNLLNQTVDAYSISLVAQRPRIMTTTEEVSLRRFAAIYEIAMNNLIAEIRLEETLRRSVVDAIYLMGIVKVHAKETIQVMVETDLWADPGTPFASNVSVDNWIPDMAASKYSRVQFAGDWYRIPFEMLEGDLFDQAEIKKQELRPTSKHHMAAGEERLDRIATGQEIDPEEIRPMIDVCDLWIPDDKMIYTFAVDPRSRFKLRGAPIAAFPPDDPDAGPYDILSFNDVPDNIVPSSPAAHLAGLSRIINNMMRKQSGKAHAQKDVFWYTPAGAKDAERIQSAQDQARIAIQEQSEVGVMKIGGVDQALQAYMTAMLQLYDRMAGNLTSIAGLGNQAPTLGQEEIIQGSVSKKEAAMQQRVIEHAERVIRRLGRMLWNDRAKVIPGSRTVPGLEEYPPLDATWWPDEREGAFDDYKFTVDVYSMPYQSPEKKFSTMVQLLQNILIPGAALMAQQGGAINFQKVVETAAHLLNAPELKDWVEFGSPPPPAVGPEQGGQGGQGEPAVEQPGMPPSTTRNYVRRSVATGGSPQNLATMAQQAWLGFSPEGHGQAPQGQVARSA